MADRTAEQRDIVERLLDHADTEDAGGGCLDLQGQPLPFREAAAEIARLREALAEVERAYYTEGKDATWRAAQMRQIATDAIEGQP